MAESYIIICVIYIFDIGVAVAVALALAVAVAAIVVVTVVNLYHSQCFFFSELYFNFVEFVRFNLLINDVKHNQQTGFYFGHFAFIAQVTQI